MYDSGREPGVSGDVCLLLPLTEPQLVAELPKKLGQALTGPRLKAFQVEGLHRSISFLHSRKTDRCFDPSGYSVPPVAAILSLSGSRVTHSEATPKCGACRRVARSAGSEWRDLRFHQAQRTTQVSLSRMSLTRLFMCALISSYVTIFVLSLESLSKTRRRVSSS